MKPPPRALRRLDLLLDLVARLDQAVDVRVDRQRLLITREGLFPAALVCVAVTQPCPGVEMARHQLHRALAVRHRAVPLLEEAMRDRSLAIGLGELRIRLDGLRE